MVVVLVGLFLPARHMAVNHPNDYACFNELVGGLRGCFHGDAKRIIIIIP